ncbi:MAG: DUF2243 domain-containing protein [Dehalococcoidia bacterium]|nr:MAG: DUF2243 domain-containing protein [Dehalococcoidia bacterium]
MASQTVRPVVVAGVVLGIGLGGFVDGILLHQLLQWHHMLTAYDHQHFAADSVEGLEVNTLWDGIFHSSTWLAVVAGLALLWRTARLPDVRWSARAFAGAISAGWGGFNLVEGVIDHHILGIHHVRDDLGGPLAWDLGFLAVGALLVVAGWLLIRSGSEQAGAPAR